MNLFNWFKPSPEKQRQTKIRILNDFLRNVSMSGRSSSEVKVFTSAEINRFVEPWWKAIINQTTSLEGNRYLNEEHSLGTFDLPENVRVFWKIDYQDRLMVKTVDPLDDECLRIITVMLEKEFIERFPELYPEDLAKEIQEERLNEDEEI